MRRLPGKPERVGIENTKGAVRFAQAAPFGYAGLCENEKILGRLLCRGIPFAQAAVYRRVVGYNEHPANAGGQRNGAQAMRPASRYERMTRTVMCRQVPMTGT